MGDASMKAQVSARRHAEEVDDFMRDMAGWESRMKAKDAELRGNKVSKMDLPAKKSQVIPIFTPTIVKFFCHEVGYP